MNQPSIYLLGIVLGATLTTSTFASDTAYTDQYLYNNTRTGSLSVIYGDGSAGGQPLRRFIKSFEVNADKLDSFMNQVFKKGNDSAIGRYEKSNRKIHFAGDKEFSALDFFMADFFIRGSKHLSPASRKIDYHLHRSADFESQVKKNLSSDSFEAIYGNSVEEQALNPKVLKTKEELDQFAQANNLSYRMTGNLDQLFPIYFFDDSKPVRFESENSVMLEVEGRLKVYASIDEISESDASLASRAFVSLENFHKLDEKMTGQKYENLSADWRSRLMQLFKASKDARIKVTAKDLLQSLEETACSII